MLEARALTKYYNHTAAVRSVSFTIQPGEILGYLGSNGAGKSTTVKMLTGMLEPSSGQIFYQGRSVHDDFTALQRRIGYVPEEAHLYPHLTGREYLQLMGRLRGMPRAILEPKMDQFLRLFSLWDDRHSALSSYSKGMRQKVLLSAALLHNPDVLILDEPFSGLDVTSALALRSLLRMLADQGKTILFSSHVLEVVQKVCTKVLILRKGEVVAYDSIDHLQVLMSKPDLEGVFAQLTDVQDTDALATQLLNVMTSVKPPTEDPPAPGPPPGIGLHRALYRNLTRAFPHEFQNVYGEELQQVTDTAIEPIWRRDGLLGLARLLLDVAIRVPAEHLAEFRQDVRYGLRALLASPGFTAVALLSLSLGICIATCAFSEMNAMVLRALPGARNPGELVAVQSPVSYPSYRRLREQRDLFSSSMAYAAPVPFFVSLGNKAERIWGHLVSTSYFSTLGARPALGRFFDASHEALGQAPVIVLSNRFWQDRLGGDPAIVGTTLRINNQPATVIGVAPNDFLGASPFLFPADIWMPVTVSAGVAPELADNALEQRRLAMFFMVGRLNPGIAIPRAEAELDSVAQQFEHDRVDLDSTQKHRSVLLVEGGKLFPLRKQDLPFFTSFLTTLALLIMLIACANVANMMLARALRRRREIAVRLALGASRARLIRQLLTESMVLALVAGVVGFLLAAWLMTLGSQARLPLPMAVTFDLRPDARVLLLTMALSLFTGLAFGLAPALQATRTDIAPALKEGGDLVFGSGAAHRRFSLRNVLIVSQVAGSLTLLVILGLLSFGIQTTLGIQAGFNPKNLYSIALDPVRDGYSGAQAAAFFEKLLDRVKTLPSVTAATLTETVPVSMAGSGVTVSTRDEQRLTIRAIQHVVGKDYFDTTGIHVLAGRSFRKVDETEHSTAVIVSETLARRLWDREEAVGRLIEIGDGEPVAPKILPGSFDHRPAAPGGGSHGFEVVGMAADVAEGLVVGRPQPAIYFPLRPYNFSHPSLQGITLMVRAVPGVDALAAVRREITALDNRVTPFNARSMTDQIDQFMSLLRMAAWVYGLVGLFGLALASVGLAGVTAYSVAQRAREIGIRIALGARNRDVLSLVMKDGLLLVAAGTIVGMAGAWAGSRLLSAMNASVGTVTSTSASDPTVLIGAPLLLAALAALACYLPARRSMSVDPAVVLRQE
jgi:macrolide transport system ATP-binding/permease protein